MDSEDEDFGPANPNYKLTLDLGAAHSKPLSQSNGNRQEATPVSSGELVKGVAWIDDSLRQEDLGLHKGRLHRTDSIVSADCWGTVCRSL